MAEQKQLDVNEPSRRRLLKGIGALGGALAITGGCPVAHAAKGNSSPGVLSPDARAEAQPFYVFIERLFQFGSCSETGIVSL